MGQRRAPDVDDLNVIAVRYLPDERTSSLSDDAFVHDGQITKQGIRAVTLADLPRGGRLVANAVTTESEAALAQSYSRFGGQLRRSQHYRGEPLGDFTGWRPQLPVTHWVVTK